MSVPSLDDVLTELEELCGREIDPALNVDALGIDSLVLAEWVYGLEERLNTVLDEDKLHELLDLPIEEIYRQVVNEAGLQPSST
jgi:acyl carrier protein